MRSRNINFDGHYGPGIVDEIISRGSYADWLELGKAALTDPLARKSIKRVTDNYKSDPTMQAYIAWEKILLKIEEDFPLKEIEEEFTLKERKETNEKIHANMG